MQSSKLPVASELHNGGAQASAERLRSAKRGFVYLECQSDAHSTVSVMAPLAELAPEVPVMTTVYAPAVVGDLNAVPQVLV
jgi:hypothetical protein